MAMFCAPKKSYIRRFAALDENGQALPYAQFELAAHLVVVDCGIGLWSMPPAALCRAH